MTVKTNTLAVSCIQKIETLFIGHLSQWFTGRTSAALFGAKLCGFLRHSQCRRWQRR
jgi:hypothetical protein